MCAVAVHNVAFAVALQVDVRVELREADGDVPRPECLHSYGVCDFLRFEIAVSAGQQPLQGDVAVGARVELAASRSNPDAAVSEGGDVGADEVAGRHAQLLLDGLALIEHACARQPVRPSMRPCEPIYFVLAPLFSCR